MRALRPRGVTVAWSSSPASRGSARRRSSPGSCGISTPGRRVLFGTCDDLSIPRPLGPIRDLVGSVSAPLEEALAAGAPSHEIQSLLIAELELPPQPTVLVLEDVHWADDATLDSITVLGRRIGSLPALLVLTFRGGEAPPGHPLRAALGAIRAERLGVPRARAAVGERRRLAGRRRRGTTCTPRPRATRSTSREMLASRPAAELPPSVANAVLGRASRLDDDAWRLVSWSRSCRTASRTSVLDAVMPDWAGGGGGAGAPAAARGRLEVRSVPPRAGAECDQVEPPDRRAAAAARRDPRGPAGGERRSGRHRPPRRSRGRRGRRRRLRARRRAAGGGAGVESGGVLPLPAGSGLRRPAPRARAGDRARGAGDAAYVVGRIDDAFPAIERAIAISGELGDDAAVGRCTRVLSRFHWFAGDGDAARAKALEAVAILEPLGESVELARAYSGLSQLAMLAEDAEQAIEWGERALELAIRLGDEQHARARADQHRQRQDPDGSPRDRDAARGARHRRRRRRPARGDACARQPRLHR